MNKQESEKTQAKKTLGRAMTVKDLGVSVDEKSVSPKAFSTWVRGLLQGWRQGTVGCKGRSDVARSGKKPWKQKGTGRARAGTSRSPLWRGGGVIFGPMPRVRTMKISKQLKRRVLQSLLTKYAQEKNIKCLDWAPNGDVPKTSAAYLALKEAGLHNQKVLLFLPSDDFITHASFANIANVNIAFFDQANAFDLANSACWLCLKKDSDAFKDMVSQWI